MLTAPEVMRELGVTRGAVHAAMIQGRLPYVEMYGRKLVRRADLEAYIQRTRPTGAKPKGRPRKTDIQNQIGSPSE